jgi:hypothetical protein
MSTHTLVTGFSVHQWRKKAPPRHPPLLIGVLGWPDYAMSIITLSIAILLLFIILR